MRAVIACSVAAKREADRASAWLVAQGWTTCLIIMQAHESSNRLCHAIQYPAQTSFAWKNGDTIDRLLCFGIHQTSNAKTAKDEIDILACYLGKHGSENLSVALHGCGEAGRDGGYADLLHERLRLDFGRTVRIDATSKVRSKANPYWRRFESELVCTGGNWIVRPGSAYWKTWKGWITSTDLRFELSGLDTWTIHDRMNDEVGPI